MERPIRIEDLRAAVEVLRSEDWAPMKELVIGEGVVLEALYFRAVELAFDSIPPERWRKA